jgi:hypothetical protein
VVGNVKMITPATASARRITGRPEDEGGSRVHVLRDVIERADVAQFVVLLARPGHVSRVDDFNVPATVSREIAGEADQFCPLDFHADSFH